MKLHVYRDNQRVGDISKNGREWSFAYSKEWLSAADTFPLSVSMPLREETYTEVQAHNFFANLLPESEVRYHIARYYGFSTKNDYELLNRLGGECAGVFTILPENIFLDEYEGYTQISDSELYEMIISSSEKPLIIGKEGVRLSLAGAQQKIPVFFDNDQFYLPKGHSASSHIIKPRIERFPYSSENEFFCLQLARSIGLNVPDIELRRINDVSFLIIQRYDRTISDGKVSRLHQEDFCQALGVSYDEKYETEGGPGFRDILKIILSHCADPMLDKRSILHWALFNFTIGNTDAHAKNLSLLYTDSSIQLAPFYDLLSTIIYPGLTKKMAMKIGGENRLSEIRERHWERFAEEVNMKVSYLMEEKEKMFAKIKESIVVVSASMQEQGQFHSSLDQIIESIESRV